MYPRVKSGEVCLKPSPPHRQISLIFSTSKNYATVPVLRIILCQSHPKKKMKKIGVYQWRIGLWMQAASLPSIMVRYTRSRRIGFWIKAASLTLLAPEVDYEERNRRGRDTRRLSSGSSRHVSRETILPLGSVVPFANCFTGLLWLASRISTNSYSNYKAINLYPARVTNQIILKLL